MTDTGHLVALETRYWHEKDRLDAATDAKEIEMRQVWVNGVRREIEDEVKFLAKRGVNVIAIDFDAAPMSDDELFAAIDELEGML